MTIENIPEPNVKDAQKNTKDALRDLFEDSPVKDEMNKPEDIPNEDSTEMGDPSASDYAGLNLGAEKVARGTDDQKKQNGVDSDEVKAAANEELRKAADKLKEAADKATESANFADKKTSTATSRLEEIENELASARGTINNLSPNKSDRANAMRSKVEEAITRLKAEKEKLQKEQGTKKEETIFAEGPKEADDTNNKEEKTEDSARKTSGIDNEDKNENAGAESAEAAKAFFAGGSVGAKDFRNGAKEDKSGFAEGPKGEGDPKNENKNENVNPEAGSAEALKNDADRLFQKVLEAEGKLQAKKNNLGKFSSAKILLGKTDSLNESDPVNKEFKEAQRELARIKEDYQGKYQEFVNKVTAEKRASLEASGLSKEEQAVVFRRFIVTEKNVAGFRKNEKGQEEKIQLSLREYIEQNEKKLRERREAVLSEKKKGNLRRLYESYSKLSFGKKMLIGAFFALPVAIGTGGVAFVSGATISAAIGVGGGKFGIIMSRKLGLVLGSIGVGLGLNKVLQKRENRQNEEDRVRSDEQILKDLESNQSDIFKICSEHANIMKKRDLKRRVIVGVSVTALAGTAIGLDAFVNGEISDVHHNNPADTTGFPRDGVAAGRHISSESVGGGAIREEALSSQKMYGQLSGDNLKHYEGRLQGRAMYENLGKMVAQKEQLLNHDFNGISKRGIWGALSDHFDGDKQQVGKALAGFRKEALADLIEKHHMSSTQADEFMKWRYGHMKSETVFSLKDGKLDIPDFADDKIINRFNLSTPNHENVMGGVDHADGKFRKLDNSRISNDYKDIGAMDSSTEELTPPANSSPIDSSTEELASPIGSNSAVDKIIKVNTDKIYGSQRYEWEAMKGHNAQDVMEGKFGNSLARGHDGQILEVDSKGEIVEIYDREGTKLGLKNLSEADKGAILRGTLDQVEINNRAELKQYLEQLGKDTGKTPFSGESVEDYIKRAEQARLGNSSGLTAADIKDTSQTIEKPNNPEGKPLAASVAQGNLEKPSLPIEDFKKSLDTDLNEHFNGWQQIKNGNTWEVMNGGDTELNAKLRVLIKNSGMIPGEGQNLEDYVKSAVAHIDGYDVPETKASKVLGKVFGDFKTDEQINQWLKIKNGSHVDFMDRKWPDNLTQAEIDTNERLRQALLNDRGGITIIRGPVTNLADYVNKALQFKNR